MDLSFLSIGQDHLGMEKEKDRRKEIKKGGKKATTKTKSNQRPQGIRIPMTRLAQFKLNTDDKISPI